MVDEPFRIFGESPNTVVDTQLDAAHQGVRLHLFVGHLPRLIDTSVANFSIPLTYARGLHMTLPPSSLLLSLQAMCTVFQHHLLLLPNSPRRGVCHLYQTEFRKILVMTH